ncbi:MAG: hypothetical protein AB7E80_11115 [Hyphomicrobiaceae bacterium]
MKTIIVALVTALTLSAAASTAQADTFTIHGMWDKVWADKKGK